MVQGDHFGETGRHSVLWDKVTAGAIPEPAATAFTAALAARGLASGPAAPRLPEARGPDVFLPRTDPG
jgi:hypothetical protein